MVYSWSIENFIEEKYFQDEFWYKITCPNNDILTKRDLFNCYSELLENNYKIFNVKHSKKGTLISIVPPLAPKYKNKLLKKFNAELIR